MNETIKVKKCRKGYKVQYSAGYGFIDIARAVWPTKEQAVIYANKILSQGDTLEIE